jgi:hypothetical protein
MPQDERESALTDGTEPDEDQPAVELYVLLFVHLLRVLFYPSKSSIFPRCGGIFFTGLPRSIAAQGGPAGNILLRTQV